MFYDQDIATELHQKFVVVAADKASNNIVFVSKTHHINCLTEELGMSATKGNPTYNLTAMSTVEVLQNHHLVNLSFGVSLSEDIFDLPKLYWIAKHHTKEPYKQDSLQAQLSALPSLCLGF